MVNLNADGATPRNEQIELRVVLERAVATSRPAMDGRKHQIFLSLPDCPVWINADSTLLEQFVVNLLTNVAKYTPEEGSLSLSLNRANDQAVIRVLAAGAGINSNLLHFIFELTRPEQDSAHMRDGACDGLSFAKSILKIHKGIIEARTLGQGRGSEFIVCLPLRAPESDMTTPWPSSTACLRLLVVDDNLDTADSLAIILRFSHHEVDVAYSGFQAIQKAAQFRPHVVLLDISLPGLDGYQVAKRLRDHPQTKKAVIIAITGYGQESDKKRAREAGFDHHLVKPVDPAELQKLLALVGRERSSET